MLLQRGKVGGDGASVMQGFLKRVRMLLRGGLWLIWLLGSIVLADAAQLVSLVGFALGSFSVYVKSGSVAKAALQAMGVDVVMGIPPPLVIGL